jgi:hypothetical protein
MFLQLSCCYLNFSLPITTFLELAILTFTINNFRFWILLNFNSKALLPEPSATIPRDKPLPQQKGETKWEEFAREKGIKKRKRERMVYHEEDGKWKPNWGYKVLLSN